MGMAQPIIDCAKCDRTAIIRRMTVTYNTSIDLETRETMHQRVAVTYHLECPDCGYSFSVMADDDPV